jgi:ABC-2 type transport system ATP-binding protein
MVQRIGLAQALINNPEVVFLDEPMSGLDPLGRRDVRQVILSLKEKGVTVFFSSHILPDVEAICDRVAMLNRGRLQQVGALHEILKVRIEAHEIVLAGLPRAAEAGLGDLCGGMTVMGERLQVRAASAQQVQAILAYALAHGASLVSVNPVRASLEDHFFREVTGAGAMESRGGSELPRQV